MTQFIKSNMETKINIAEILKDKPKGTKLYSPLFGDVYLLGVEAGIIRTEHHGKNETLATFYRNGKYFSYPESELLLFPSKEMRDWSKFAWKKGDVLVSNDDDRHIIFNGFSNTDYTTFKGKHWISINKKRYIPCLNVQNTQDYHIENDKEAAKTYINAIERELGGKLNLETLEIENTQPKFKDGDIVTATSDFDSIFIGVLKKNIKDFPNNELRFYCALENKKLLAFDGLEVTIKAIKTSLATEKEKQLFFAALAMGGKAWDAEKKEIVDLKPKWTPKTFDKVITRDFDDGVWSANIFSHMNSQGEYVSIGCVEGYAYCLPYNEETAKLIGTTNNAK